MNLNARAAVPAVFLSGVAVAITVGLYASGGSDALVAGDEPCALTQAMQDAINKKIQIIGMTSPDPGKYFSVGGSDSCLGEFAVANVDLSRAIPDPMGLMSDAVSGAIEKVRSAAIKKVCTAARGTIGDIIGRYNSAVTAVNNVPGQAMYLIDSNIGIQSRQAMDRYAMEWNVGQTGSSGDILGGAIPSAGGQLPRPATTGVQILPQNGTNSSRYTIAAANFEAARQNLEVAKQAMAGLQPGDGKYEAAASRLSVAQTTFNQAQAELASAKSAVVTGGQTAPSGSTSTGGSVF